MKQLLSVIAGLGMSVAAPAYAVDPETAQEMAEYRREMREIRQGTDTATPEYAAKPETATGRKEKQPRLAEESRQGLVHLLGNTQECSTVTIGDEGNLGCYYEWLAGGCRNDELKSREVHHYGLNQARHIRVVGQQMNLTVDGNKMSYHFPDAKSAQQAKELLTTYQQNFVPPAPAPTPTLLEKVHGCRF